MSLINCPECGQSVSDKAAVCPHCGINIASEPNKDTENTVIIQEKELKRKKSKKKIIPIIVILIIIAVVAIVCIFVLPQTSLFEPKVSSINFSEWELSGEPGSKQYKVTLTSDTKKPFVCIMGTYPHGDDDFDYFDPVFMKDGIGYFRASGSLAQLNYERWKPLGYLTGKTVGENEFSYTSTDSRYYDSGYCKITLDVEFDNDGTGLFFCNISNDTTYDVDTDIIIPVINGVGQKEIKIDDLPRNIHDVQLIIEPLLFVEAEDIKQEDFSIIQPLEKIEGLVPFYNNEVIEIKNASAGYLLYTFELSDDANKKYTTITKPGLGYIEKSGLAWTDEFYIPSDVTKPNCKVQYFATVKIKEFEKDQQ